MSAPYDAYLQRLFITLASFAPAAEEQCSCFVGQQAATAVTAALSSPQYYIENSNIMGNTSNHFMNSLRAKHSRLGWAAGELLCSALVHPWRAIVEHGVGVAARFQQCYFGRNVANYDLNMRGSNITYSNNNIDNGNVSSVFLSWFPFVGEYDLSPDSQYNAEPASVQLEAFRDDFGLLMSDAIRLWILAFALSWIFRLLRWFYHRWIPTAAQLRRAEIRQRMADADRFLAAGDVTNALAATMRNQRLMVTRSPGERYAWRRFHIKVQAGGFVGVLWHLIVWPLLFSLFIRSVIAVFFDLGACKAQF